MPARGASGIQLGFFRNPGGVLQKSSWVLQASSCGSSGIQLLFLRNPAGVFHKANEDSSEMQLGVLQKSSWGFSELQLGFFSNSADVFQNAVGVVRMLIKLCKVDSGA